MGIEDIANGIETVLMVIGLILVLPPVFIYKSIKFMKE